jgi:hypothetical protein
MFPALGLEASAVEDSLACRRRRPFCATRRNARWAGGGKS